MGAHQDKNINAKLQIIKQVNMLSDLNTDESLELANISELCSFKKGTRLYREGDNPYYIYIIYEGKVVSYCHTVSGRIVIGNISKDMIGLHNIFTNEPRWLCAEAEDNVLALKLTRENFILYLKKNNRMQLKFLVRADKMLNIIVNRLKLVIGSSSEQRIIDVLYGLYEKFGPSLQFKRAEIADLAGLSRETTIRNMSNLKKQGIIKSVNSGYRIEIKDINRLKILKQYSPII